MSVAFTREESAETAAPLRRKENGRNYLPQRWTNYRARHGARSVFRAGLRLRTAHQVRRLQPSAATPVLGFLRNSAYKSRGP
jgi:hypothetical protein